MIGLGTACGQQASKISTAQVSHLPHSELSVLAHHGDITVHGDASVNEVSIKAQQFCGGWSKEEAQRRLEGTQLKMVRGKDGVLAISVDFPEPRHLEDRANLIITLPKSAQADIETSNGEVVVNNLRGNVDVETSNGGIQLAHIQGNVNAESSNGQIQLNDVDGEIDVRASNSDVVALMSPHQRGAVDITSNNGDVHLIVEK